MSVNLNPVTSGYNLSKINADFVMLQDAHNDVAAWTNGGNNTWQQDIDLNSNDLLNTNVIHTNSLILGGSAVVPGNLGSFAPNSVGTTQIVDGAVTSDKVASLDSAKALFTQLGVGATLRNVSKKLQDLGSVKDFGALGNNIQNDVSAFTQQQTQWGIIVVPPGTYKISSNLSITVPIMFYPGAVLAPDTGVTISISNTIIADEHRIFDASNGGGFSLSSEAASLYAAWFGILPANTAAVNTARFNIMMNSVPASSGCHIMWPAGQINVNSCSHPLSGVWQQGHSAGTWIINNTTNQPALEATGGNFSNVFSNFRIGQAVGVTPTSGNCGIHVQSHQSKVYDNNCFNFPAPLFDGIFLDGCTGAWLQRNLCSSLLNNGFHFGGGCGDVFVDSNYSTGNSQNGFYFNGMSGLYGQNLNGFGNGQSCYYFDNTGHLNGSGTVNEFIMANNWVGDTSVGANYSILNLADSVFTNCWGSTQQNAAVNPFSPGFNITGSGCDDIGFINCQALINNGDGFLVDQGASNIRFVGCKAKGNGRGNIAGIDNGFHLGLGAAVNNITMIGCRASGSAAGIFIGAFASDYLVVSGCNNQGNTGALIVNNSTGTHNAIGTGANV